MKVIIAGSRTFSDYNLLSIVCENFAKSEVITQIVSGGAKGADKLGERYAMDNGYDLKIFPADWDSLGKRAGHIRNAQMAEYADALIAFWDGKSKGTAHMIEIAKDKGLRVEVICYHIA